MIRKLVRMNKDDYFKIQNDIIHEARIRKAKDTLARMMMCSISNNYWYKLYGNSIKRFHETSNKLCNEFSDCENCPLMVGVGDMEEALDLLFKEVKADGKKQ